MIIFKKFLLISAAIFFLLFLFAVFAFPKSIPVYAAAQCDRDFEKSCAGGCIGANDICCGSGYCTLGNQCTSINGRSACIPNGTSVCGNGYCESGTNCTSTSSGYVCIEPGRQQCGSGNSFCYVGNTCVNPSIPLCCPSGYSQCGTGCAPPGVSCCNLPGTSYYCPRQGDVCRNTDNTAAGLYCAPADWTSCGGGWFCPFNLSCNGTGSSGTCNGVLTFPTPQNGEVMAQVNANVRWQQSSPDFGVIFMNWRQDNYWCSIAGATCFPVNGYLSRIVLPVWAAVGNPTGYRVTVLEENQWGNYIRRFPAVTVSHTDDFSFMTVNFPPDSRPEVKTWNRYYISFGSLGGSGNYFITVGDQWNGYTLDAEAIAVYVMPKKEVNQGLAPEPVFGPWIQTFGGDVHSNTRINTPGGP